MKIGLDVSGGDFAPDVNIIGAIQSLNELPNDVTIVLFGDESQIKEQLELHHGDLSRFEIIHAPEIITMSDHPARAVMQKPNSSIAIGYDALAKGDIDAFASTGNTGAMMVGAMYKIQPVPGILRPCITSNLPMIDGTNSIILDVGTNADCKPDILYQFAKLGSVYSKFVYGVENPKIGLLNIGEEEEKGNMLSIATHRLLKESQEINFIGNVEGRDLFSGKADVVVCDGFTGNVVLKEAEAIYALLRKRNIKDEYFDRFNYENYGGTPILGVNGNAIIGHGISNQTAVKNMIKHSYEVALNKLSDRIKEAFN